MAEYISMGESSHAEWVWRIEAAERCRSMPSENSAYDSFAQCEAALLDRLAPEERTAGTSVPGQGDVGADRVMFPREVADYLP